MTREQMILDYMKKLKISREEAEQLWEDDQEDFIGEEGEKMQEKAKEIRRYEKGDKPRAKAPREKKIDKDKVLLLNTMTKSLDGLVIFTKDNPGTEVSFVYNGENYTVKLTKHRKK